MASVSLRRTQSSGNRQKWTYSAWIKRTGIGVLGSLIGSSSTNDDNGYGQIRFQADDTLNYTAWTGEWFTTNRKFKDPNAWYHVVVRVDTTQGNVTHRIRLYINGIEETSFSSSMNPSSGQNLSLNVNNYYVYLGAESYSSGTSRFFDGVISHIHFLDGEDRTPDYFGETDSTTGEWKIKTNVTGVNYGTNGFFILKDGNSVTDQSGNSNNFTVAGGTLTNTEDCPSNVFCTANALSKGSDTVLSNGNTTARNDTNANSATIGTIAFGNGKYYWEGYRHGGGNIGIGICLASVDGSSHDSVEDGRVLYYENGSIFCNGLSDQANISTGVTYGDTDIISVSIDTENGVLKFYKNDTLVTNSTITNSKLTNSENIWVPTTYQNNGGEWRLNFGNGYFGTTAVSSAGTNASGNGIFEYDVPTGFTALSTKGLNL